MTVVVFFDVDNTLFDTERFRTSLHSSIEDRVGPSGVAAFWAAYEAVRAELGVVDVPEALRRLDASLPRVAQAVEAAIAVIPFAEFVVPAAAAAIAAATSLGRPVIVSDGDAAFQRRKIERAGLAAAVDGRVHVFHRKEAHIDELMAAYPAERYWLVDDKSRVLRAFKRVLGDRITTVHIAYGAYASAQPEGGADFAPDHTIAQLGELVPLLGRGEA
jgi:phosphoglycolate phosphatase-like HAD superfamily hydrolase